MTAVPFARTCFWRPTSRRPLPDIFTRTIVARPARLILNFLRPSLSLLRCFDLAGNCTARAVSSVSVPETLNGHLIRMPTTPRAVIVTDRAEIAHRLDEADTLTPPLVTFSQSAATWSI